MDISVEESGKKFFREWVYRKLTYRFLSGKSYAVTGPNGSGKSTLLKALSGSIPASEGNIRYEENGREIHPDLWPRYISYAAPYLEVVEEFTLKELLQFHFSFKSPASRKENIPELAEKMYLQDALDKEIRYYSSGMKQRLKLGLAFFTQSPVLLLDEPTSNLDSRGIDWYLQQIDRVKDSRLLIICSNQKYEYGFCDETLRITDFKKVKYYK